MCVCVRERERERERGRENIEERCLAMTSRNDSEANWNRRTDGQDHALSQADTLTKMAKDELKNVSCQKLFANAA